MELVSVTEIKKMLIETFEMDLSPEEIEDDITLFDGGLEIDSVDILEILLKAEKIYGIKFEKGDIPKEAFSNIKTLTDYFNKLIKEQQSCLQA